MITYLAPSELTAALTLRDLSDPAAGPHAMQLLLDAVLDRLGTAWPIPHDVRRTSPLVAVTDNYDHLGYAAVRGDPGPPLLALRQSDGDAAQPHLGGRSGGPALAERTPTTTGCWCCPAWSTAAT